MKVETRTLPLTDTLVASHIEECLQPYPYGSKVMIDQPPKGCRRHLRAHRDAAGNVFIRVGARGHDKRELTGCRVIFLDDQPAVFAFRL